MKNLIRAVFTVLLLVAWCTLIPGLQKKVVNEEVVLSEKDSIESTSETNKVDYLMVRTTYYNPVESQCDSNPLVTADGSNINLRKLKKGHLRWIAVSRDLLVEYPLGTKVKVTSTKYPEISGIYEIHDVMNPRFRYSIDVLSHVDHGHIFGTHLTKIEKV